MPQSVLTATTLARNFSEYLNQVRYQGASFDIERNSEIVAHIGPPAPSGGYPIENLAAFFAGLPEVDGDSFLRDIHEAVDSLATEADAWDS